MNICGLLGLALESSINYSNLNYCMISNLELPPCVDIHDYKDLVFIILYTLS